MRRQYAPGERGWVDFSGAKIQQEVYACGTPTTVEFLKDRTRLASHPRSEVLGGKTTDRSHMPEHQLA